MQDAPKAVWSIPYVSVAFCPSLKHNFIAYRSSEVSDYIFENHQLWQSGFSRVYTNSCCSCSFEAEIIKTGQSSHQMYSNNVLIFQVSTTILNACSKKSGNLLKAPRIFAGTPSQKLSSLNNQNFPEKNLLISESLIIITFVTLFCIVGIYVSIPNICCILLIDPNKNIIKDNERTSINETKHTSI